MSFQMPPGPGEPPNRPTGRPGGGVAARRSRALLPTLVVLGGLMAAFGLWTSLYTDYLWFDDVGYTRVFATELATKVLLFVLGAVVMGGAVAANLVVAFRARPVYAPLSPEQQNLERYRQSVEPFRRLVLIAGSGLLGLLAGSTAAGEWQTYLLWRNGQPFGRRDPQFDVDISFFAFDLPWWRFVVGFGFAVVIVSLLASLGTHYLYGGLRLQSPGERTSPGTRVHLSVLLGLFVLLKGVAYWLDRYSLAVKEGRVGRTDFVGLTFTDVNAVLPAKAALAAISVICAVLFFVNVFRRGWLLPGVGVGLLLLAAILIGSVYPAGVQRFNVRPSEPTKEKSYIANNIAGTRAAYDIADVEVRDYAATTDIEPGQLRDDADTIPGIRLLDPAVVSPAYRQLQQVRGYYGFPDTLDVDRYLVNRRMQDAVVSVRELDLDGIGEAQRNWANDHVVYTHGFGFVSARGNTRDRDGRPSFFVSDIPPRGSLGDFEPRIYFGEQSPRYSIVGASQGARPRELDYPSDEAGDEGQRNNTYRGEGGVAVGSFLRKVLYAVKFQETNILLSSLVNPESKILYERTPRERVEKVAPWLHLDGNAYPAIVDKRIVWILDGYTTSDSYPYSNRTSLSRATEDALTRTSAAVVAQVDERVNYIRNSVKATVDAYDGTVRLYEWDEEDPILRSWMRAFPGTVTDRSKIDRELLSHLRYPEDLFKVQRTLLAQYHVTDPEAFYSGQDFWRVPTDPRPGQGGQRAEQPPYFLTLQMPGQKAATFSLTTSYVPRQRDNLAAFAAVNAEPGEDYGQIRMLVLPRSTTVKGPGQVQNEFSADPDVATTINLLRRGDTDVRYGNLLTLPVGGGLLYVEPVYVEASGESSYPLLQKVLVAFGDQIGFANTLQEALDQVFAGDAGAGTTEPGAEPPPSGEEPPGERPPAAGNAALQAALRDMQAAINAADAALRRGDFAAYGAAQQRLRAALQRALQAERAAGGGGGTATPTPSPTPSPAATAAATAAGAG